MRKDLWIALLSLLGLLLLLLLSLRFGSVPISWSAAMQPDSPEHLILKQRFLSAMAALLCGAALSLCGLLMQTFFRNMLADPYILGISSGSGLGVSLLIIGSSALGSAWMQYSFWRQWSLAMAAAAGAATVLLALLFFAPIAKRASTLLIAGVLAGSLCNALTALLQVYASKEDLQFYFFWSMSSFRNISAQQLLILAMLLPAALLLAWRYRRDLDLFLLSESHAEGLGVNRRRLRRHLLLLTALLAGSVTAFAGPVGFVGLMSPHAARWLLRSSEHRRLLPLSALLGAALCLLCHLLSSGLGAEWQLPLNVFTALIGVPFMAWLLWRNEKKNTHAALD